MNHEEETLEHAVERLTKALEPFAERYRRGSRDVEEADAYRAIEVRGRQTGRTTRMLEQVLAAAAKGQRVAVVCNNVRGADYIRARALELCRGDAALVRTIKFVPERQADGGFAQECERNRSSIFVDHAARVESRYFWEIFDLQQAQRVTHAEATHLFVRPFAQSRGSR